MFDLGDLCLLLDIDHAGKLSVFPAPDEIAVFLGEAARPIVRSGQTVETRGQLRFRSGLLRVYAPPEATLESTLWRCALNIDDFADSSIYTHLSEWASSYLGDTLERLPKSKGRGGYRRFRGDGVIVDLGFWPPRVADRGGEIQVQVTHDEPLGVTLRRILRVQDGAAWSVDGESRLASDWDMRMTSRADDASIEVRWSAPSRSGDYATNDASRCSSWLDWFLIHHFDNGHAAGDNTTAWSAPTPSGSPPEKVTRRTLNTEDRHTSELRFPRRWVEDARSA